MTIHWWLAYLLTTTILSLSPGFGAITTMSTGISHGYRGAFTSIAGLQVGLAILIALVGVGLGALFSQSALAFVIVKWAGAAWLFWLGIQQWRTAGAIDLKAVSTALPQRRLFERALLVNITNPKSLVFLAALFPQFIQPGEPQALQYVVLGVTTVGVDILVMIGYATLATHIAAWIKGPREMRLLNRIFGGLFMAVSALLASARRVA